MADNKKSSYNQVSFEEHYRVFKNVENKIMDHLAELDHEEFLVGLRVAYDFLDSSNEPDVLPYTIEFGHLGPVDSALKCSRTDETVDEKIWLKTTRSGGSVHPVPLDLLDSLYEETKADLEKLSEQELKIGIFVVLYGSPIMVYSVSCTCANRKRKYCSYNRTTRVSSCYCSTRTC